MIRFIFIVFLFLGCGYKSVYNEQLLKGDNVYVKVKVNIDNPKTSIYVRDIINEAFIYKFKKKITSLDKSNTQVYVTLNSVNISPVSYDENGFANFYNVNVKLNIKVQQKDFIQNFNVSGNSSFPAKVSSIINENIKNRAIREATRRAIDEFITKFYNIGFNNDNK